MIASIDPAFLFWLVILVLYLLDNIKLLWQSELLLSRDLCCSWEAQLHAIPFVIGSRHVYITNFLFPFSLVIKASWMTDSPLSPAKLRRAKRELVVLDARLFPYKLIASSALLILLVIGPVETVLLGFPHAVFIILIPYSSTLLALVYFLAIQRKYFGFSWGQLTALLLELVVCPGFCINIVRRLSLSKTLSQFDGVGFCLMNSASGEASNLLASVDMRISDYIEQSEGDPEAITKLQAYRNAIR